MGARRYVRPVRDAATTRRSGTTTIANDRRNMITHDEQPTVKMVWEMPPQGPNWYRCYRVVELPLGVAIMTQEEGKCRPLSDDTNLDQMVTDLVASRV
jgi:hypothetical protein